MITLVSKSDLHSAKKLAALRTEAIRTAHLLRFVVADKLIFLISHPSFQPPVSGNLMSFLAAKVVWHHVLYRTFPQCVSKVKGKPNDSWALISILISPPDAIAQFRGFADQLRFGNAIELD
jgi:hypothetical protein